MVTVGKSYNPMAEYVVVNTEPSSSPKLLARWQGPFVVTQRVGVLREVVWSDRGGTTQIYHLNLNLNAWKEAETASLVSLATERDELGPEVQNSTISDGHLTQAQRAF